MAQNIFIYRSNVLLSYTCQAYLTLVRPTGTAPRRDVRTCIIIPAHMIPRKYSAFYRGWRFMNDIENIHVIDLS